MLEPREVVVPDTISSKTFMDINNLIAGLQELKYTDDYDRINIFIKIRLLLTAQKNVTEVTTDTEKKSGRN